MQNETFYLCSNHRGCDVEVWDHRGEVWLCLDNGDTDRASRAFTAAEARELAAALLQFADRVK